MPLELRIGRAFKADVVKAPLPTSSSEYDYSVRLDLALKVLETHNMV